MNNLLGKFKPKTVIVCRNFNKEIVGVYETVTDAADDYLIDQQEIFDAVDSKKQLLGSGFWSRETFMFMLTPKESKNINKKSIQNRGKHRHSATSVSVVQLDYETLAFVARYDSMYEAFAKTGARNISKCCRGEACSSGGYKWMFEEDYETLTEEKTDNFEDLM